MIDYAQKVFDFIFFKKTKKIQDYYLINYFRFFFNQILKCSGLISKLSKFSFIIIITINFIILRIFSIYFLDLLVDCVCCIKIQNAFDWCVRKQNLDWFLNAIKIYSSDSRRLDGLDRLNSPTSEKPLE